MEDVDLSLSPSVYVITWFNEKVAAKSSVGLDILGDNDFSITSNICLLF
eukprot:COSAG01_NODE_13224_length_1617_cov_1.761528_2_plen_49_part_00